MLLKELVYRCVMFASQNKILYYTKALLKLESAIASN